MNPNDIRIMRVFTQQSAAPPILTDDSVNAMAGGFDLVIEWEAGNIVNATAPNLTLNVATRNIITNALVGALTFSKTVTPDATGFDKMYQDVTPILPGVLTANEMYEVSACLVNGAAQIHSYVHSWVFVAY